MGQASSNHDKIETMETETMEYHIRQRQLPHQRKLTICEESAKDDLIEKVIVVPTILNQKTERWLFQILRNHYLFCSLADNDILRVIKKMVKCTADAEDYVFKIDDRPGAFFVIEKGNVDVEGKSGYKKANLSPDDTFGELGLLYNSTRTASIKAKVDCQFWCLTKTNFKTIEKQIVRQNYKNSIKHINQLQIFEYITEEQKNSIACSMFTLKFPKNSIIYKKHDQATSLFIIKTGEVALKDQGKQTSVKQNSYFGDECFEQGKKPLRITTAETLSVVQCLSISRQGIKNIMGDNVKQLINYNIIKSALYKSSFFSKLDPINIQKLIHLSKTKTMKNQQVLFEAQRQPTRIVIILYGSGQDQMIGTLLGQDFMLLDRKPSIAIKKQGDGQICQISYEKIIKILKETSMESIRRKKNNIVDEDSIEEGYQMEDIQELRDESRLQNLTFIKMIQEQQFPHEKTLLVENQQTGSLFSMRMITKSKLNLTQNDQIIKSLVREKQILAELQHPFLVKMINSVKTPHYLFLMYEYNWCYSLFSVIREIGLLNRSVTRFYIASLVLALQYLHTNLVIFRDLKPQNIVVYKNGYIKLNNFLCAKKLSKDIGYRTFTQIGTPHYMAPEIIAGKGYSFAADLWSLGIIFYEFVVGKVPFGEDEDDPFKIHQLVLSRNVSYPNIYQDESGKQLIQQFLNKSPELRLSKGYNNLKAHSYFNTINWTKLARKEEIAPFKSKKFYFGEVIPFNIKLKQYIEDSVKKMPKSSKVIEDWDETF